METQTSNASEDFYEKSFRETEEKVYSLRRRRTNSALSVNNICSVAGRRGFMSSPSSQEVTRLLVAWSNGDRAALDQLMPVVYAELHRMAHRHLGNERPGHTLQTSAIVNEAYLRLVGQKPLQWQNRAHFFGVAAQLMRHILVDHARARHNARRGGGAIRLALEEAAEVSTERSAELVALDDALTALAAFDERKSRMVELRFFGGLSIEETAEVLKVSPGTVMREWTLAKAWLQCEISRQ
jgi:RNA polymerase sigma factor (TIGR02999 family)